MDLELLQRAGINHQAPDALSRLKTEETDKTNLNEELLALMINETNNETDVQKNIWTRINWTKSKPASTRTLTIKKKTADPDGAIRQATTGALSQH